MTGIEWIEDKIRKAEKKLDEDSASLEITGEYVHYKSEKGFEKAISELNIMKGILHDLQTKRYDLQNK